MTGKLFILLPRHSFSPFSEPMSSGSLIHFIGWLASTLDTLLKGPITFLSVSFQPIFEQNSLGLFFNFLPSLYLR